MNYALSSTRVVNGHTQKIITTYYGTGEATEEIFDTLKSWHTQIQQLDAPTATNGTIKYKNMTQQKTAKNTNAGGKADVQVCVLTETDIPQLVQYKIYNTTIQAMWVDIDDEFYMLTGETIRSDNNTLLSAIINLHN